MIPLCSITSTAVAANTSQCGGTDDTCRRLAENGAFPTLCTALAATEVVMCGLVRSGQVPLVVFQPPRSRHDAATADALPPPHPPPVSNPLRHAAMRARGVFDMPDLVPGVPGDPAVSQADGGVIVALRRNTCVTRQLALAIAAMVTDRPSDTRGFAGSPEGLVAPALVRAATVLLPGDKVVGHAVAQAFECLAGACLPGQDAWRRGIAAAGGIECLAGIAEDIMVRRAKPTPDGPAIEPRGQWRQYTWDDAPAVSVQPHALAPVADSALPAADETGDSAGVNISDAGSEDGQCGSSDGIVPPDGSVVVADAGAVTDALLAALFRRYGVSPWAPSHLARDLDLWSSRGLEAMSSPSALEVLQGLDVPTVRSTTTLLAVARTMATLAYDESSRPALVRGRAIEVLLSALHLAPRHPLTHALLVEGATRLCTPQRRAYRPPYIRRATTDVEARSQAVATAAKETVVANRGSRALAIAMLGRLRDPATVTTMCGLVRDMAAHSAELQTRMGEDGLLDVLVAALGWHRADGAVANEVLPAVFDLLHNCGAYRRLRLLPWQLPFSRARACVCVWLCGCGYSRQQGDSGECWAPRNGAGRDACSSPLTQAARRLLQRAVSTSRASYVHATPGKVLASPSLIVWLQVRFGNEPSWLEPCKPPSPHDLGLRLRLLSLT